MKIEVLRFSDNSRATGGLMFIDGAFQCFTLEDEKRQVKVKEETCIPVGEYEIKLRTEGTHHEKYRVKYPDFHIGMLHLQNVPNFQYILIHIGNSEKDSAGCLLVGNQITKALTLVDSTGAYIDMYKKVAPALKRGERVTIKITEWH